MKVVTKIMQLKLANRHGIFVKLSGYTKDRFFVCNFFANRSDRQLLLVSRILHHAGVAATNGVADNVCACFQLFSLLLLKYQFCKVDKLWNSCQLTIFRHLNMAGIFYKSQTIM